jgi:hypothetical protein
MNPKLRTLIDGVRESHTSVLWLRGKVADPKHPWCSGCLKLRELAECPVLQAANSLEEAESVEP